MTMQFFDQLGQLVRRSLLMASLVEDMVEESCEAILQSGDALARRVIERDVDVDSEEVEVEREAIRLMALYQPMGKDLLLLCTILKINNDLERVADCAVNIAERAVHLDPRASSAEVAELRELYPAALRSLRRAVQAYATRSTTMARDVLKTDDVVDALYAKLVRGMIGRASKSPETLAAYLDVHSIAKNLERIADHATNIAEDVIFLTTGTIVRHGRGRGAQEEPGEPA